MKPLFLCISILLTTSILECRAQNYRILFTSDDLERSDTTQAILYIRMDDINDKVWVKYKDGRLVKIKNNTIWGMIDDKKSIYRLYNGDAYKVTSLGPSVVYERTATRHVGKPMNYTAYTERYTSTGLNGNINLKVLD